MIRLRLKDSERVYLVTGMRVRLPSLCCGDCAGTCHVRGPSGLSTICPGCRGSGSLPQHVPGTVRIRPKLSLADLERWGFSRTGEPVESLGTETLLRVLRKWIEAPTPIDPFQGEKAHWAWVLARSGWFLPPLPWEVAGERHKGKEVRFREEEERKRKEKRPVIRPARIV